MPESVPPALDMPGNYHYPFINKEQPTPKITNLFCIMLEVFKLKLQLEYKFLMFSLLLRQPLLERTADLTEVGRYGFIRHQQRYQQNRTSNNSTDKHSSTSLYVVTFLLFGGADNGNIRCARHAHGLEWVARTEIMNKISSAPSIYSIIILQVSMWHKVT